ncbi:MAG: leucine-rich repeat domain-containing protein [Bacteroidia bacterium]
MPSQNLHLFIFLTLNLFFGNLLWGQKEAVKLPPNHVLIADTSFFDYLQDYHFACVDTNLHSFDTTCVSVKNETKVDLSLERISDLSDLKYFRNLRKLNCAFNFLKEITWLPPNLEELYCDHNQLTGLPKLPRNLRILDCSNNQMTQLPPLTDSLEKLYCQYNSLSKIDSFPMKIKVLNCAGNRLEGLSFLPDSLTHLYCYQNQLTTLPLLPRTLQTLWCNDNRLMQIAYLPENLEGLYVFNNTPLDNLPLFPYNLKEFSCHNTTIRQVIYLPKSLTYLNLDDTKIECVPNIPDGVSTNKALCEIKEPASTTPVAPLPKQGEILPQKN